MVIDFDYGSIKIITDNISYLIVQNSMRENFLVKRDDILDFHIIWDHCSQKWANGEVHTSHLLYLKFKYNNDSNTSDSNTLKAKQNNVTFVQSSSEDKEFIQNAYNEINSWINTEVIVKIQKNIENAVGYTQMIFKCGQLNSSITISNDKYITIIDRVGKHEISREKLLDVSIRDIKLDPVKRNIRYGTRMGRMYMGSSSSYYEKSKSAYILDFNYIGTFNKIEHIAIFNSTMFQINSIYNAINKWKDNGYDESIKGSSNDNNGYIIGVLATIFAIFILALIIK